MSAPRRFALATLAVALAACGYPEFRLVARDGATADQDVADGNARDVVVPSADGADVSMPDGAVPPDAADVTTGTDAADVTADVPPVPIVLTIPQIRDPARGARPAENAWVMVRNVVVTAVKNAPGTVSFFFVVQDPTADSYAGLQVFVGTTAPTVAVGDVVDVTGAFQVFRMAGDSTFLGTDQINVSRDGVVNRAGTTGRVTVVDIAPSQIAGAAPSGQALQSQLVRVSGVYARTATDRTEFTLEQDGLVVSSFLANHSGPSPFPAVAGQMFSSITGIVTIFRTSYQLSPRNATDVVSP